MQAETSAHHPVNHVFVDLENVKHIEAGVLDGKGVRLHLFLGPQNKKLNVEVVEKLLEHRQAVQIVRSPLEGRNALDFVLAYHLGQAVLTDPNAYYHIVAKDTGYDSLVDWLSKREVKVQRHDDWSRLNFRSPSKPAVAVTSPTPAATKAPATPALSNGAEKLLENLKKLPKAKRPKKEKKLTAQTENWIGKDKPGVKATALKVIAELKKAKRIAVDEKGALSYQL